MEEDNPPTGAESKTQIDERVKDFLNMLKKEYSDKKILVVTHAGTFLSILRVLNKENMSIRKLRNG